MASRPSAYPAPESPPPLENPRLLWHSDPASPRSTLLPTDWSLGPSLPLPGFALDVNTFFTVLPVRPTGLRLETQSWFARGRCLHPTVTACLPLPLPAGFGVLSTWRVKWQRLPGTFLCRVRVSWVQFMCLSQTYAPSNGLTLTPHWGTVLLGLRLESGVGPAATGTSAHVLLCMRIKSRSAVCLRSRCGCDARAYRWLSLLISAAGETCRELDLGCCYPTGIREPIKNTRTNSTFIEHNEFIIWTVSVLSWAPNAQLKTDRAQRGGVCAVGALRTGGARPPGTLSLHSDSCWYITASFSLFEMQIFLNCIFIVETSVN